MMNEKIPCIGLNRHAEKRVRENHPWIFSNEVAEMDRLTKMEPGALVEVLDCHGNYVGTGFINPKSLISIRIISRNRGKEIDSSFWQNKLHDAIRIRETVYGAHSHAEGTYRAVFGESDGLPGLVIDRFGPVWVMEPHAVGMSVRAEVLAEALRAVAERDIGKNSVEAIVLRTDARSAQLEGITQENKILFGALPKDGVWAVEGNIRFPVDVLSGQKTGFFFDQRENRTAFCNWISSRVAEEKTRGRVADLKVLDVFCHLGAWGLRALKSGASHATFIDQSSVVLEGIKTSAKILGVLDKCEFICGDAEEAMKKLSKNSFDAVAVDPPAFIQSKKHVPQGLKAYGTVNALGAKLVKPGGILSASTCSYHCEEARFELVVGVAIRSVGKEPKMIWRGGAAWDHPALAGVQESRYLKNILFSL